MTSDANQTFLVAYGYGTGGLWGVMRARGVEEIVGLYPELDIVAEPPRWMTPEFYSRLAADPYDIADMPIGLSTPSRQLKAC